MNRRTLLLCAATSVLAPDAFAAAPDRFSVKATGKGPDIILIPGLACSGEVWDQTVARLSKDHRLHVLTLAGFGGAPAGPNASGSVLAPVADAIAAYVVSEKLARPAVIGHSVGGFLGLSVAARNPDLIDRLLIVDALPFYSLVFNPAATVAMATPPAGQSKAMILAQTPAAFEQAQTFTARALTKTEAGRKAVLAWSLASDRGVMAQAMYEAMTTDLRPELAGIRTSVTVLYPYDAARGGPAPDNLYGAAYSTLPGVRLHRVEDSYHFIMLDQPEAFAREVDSFLA